MEGKTMKLAELIVELASSGTKHVLKFARAANVTKVIYTGSFSNVLHPDYSWNPIVVTESGKLIERVARYYINLFLLDWNSQTADDCKKLGLHPWCMHTAAQVIAEREIWNFSDANPDIDITSSTFTSYSISKAILTPRFCAVLPGFPFGPYGRGQAVDLHRSGTFAWVSELLNGPPSRTSIPNAAPFSPNYVHIADVARAHVTALRVGPLKTPQRKRILLVAGYMLWSEVIVHLAKVIPELRLRLPSPTGSTAVQPSEYARFEARNAREILGIEEYRSWQEAIEDAVKDMLRVELKTPGPRT
jgi:nucleoside-diphosphate-sugar epimerase